MANNFFEILHVSNAKTKGIFFVKESGLVSSDSEMSGSARNGGLFL